jgi:LacI family transcriptional regulator
MSPRVLVLLNTEGAWSRGILRGFIATAHERGWTLLHYNSSADLQWLSTEFTPAAALVGHEFDADALRGLAPAILVSATADRTESGIASVCLDEGAIGELACDHLLATGLRNLCTFRYGEASFAITRERAFQERAKKAGAQVRPGWGDPLVGHGEDPKGMVAWVQGLPRPCGIFTCTDGWGRAVARYLQLAGLRIPEDVALVGADNDDLECELISPPLSSVLIPWREVGKSAAELLASALAGEPIAGRRVSISPITVIGRRSSELLAVDDTLVARAVEWIRGNTGRRITVPMVAKAVAGGRHRLERAFRRVLGRTMQEEIRRAHVEAARRMLHTSRASLGEIAQKSGFSSAALLSVAFQRELGVAPGLYRRRVQRELGGTGVG